MVNYNAVKCDAQALLKLDFPRGVLSITMFSKWHWGFSRALKDVEYKLVNDKETTTALNIWVHEFTSVKTFSSSITKILTLKSTNRSNTRVSSLYYIRKISKILFF